LEAKVALQYTVSGRENIRFFVNNAESKLGTAYVIAIFECLTKIANNYARIRGMHGDHGKELPNVDIRTGLTFVVSATVEFTECCGEIDRVVFSESKIAMRRVVLDKLKKYFADSPEVIESMLSNGISASRKRAESKASGFDRSGYSDEWDLEIEDFDE
jgi:DNA gyrase/topoisomerase IV subunit B